MSAPTLPPDRSHVATEAVHDGAHDLHALSIEASIDAIATDHDAVLKAFCGARAPLAALIRDVIDGLGAGGRLVYVGAGTSGRLGVLDASECPPTFSVSPEQVIGIIAGGDSALRRSSESREDVHDGANAELEQLGVGSNDVLVGIAAGGTTPYVLGAIEEAARRGARTALITCAQRDCPAGCDHLIVFDTGAELLTGSTRLKAGSVTKLALNTITTTAFAQLGKVRGNLMIDLRATNDKLRDRAIRMLVQLFPELDRAHAAQELDQDAGSLRATVRRLETESTDTDSGR